MTRAGARTLARALEREGMLLVHDKELPSATATVVGEPFGGSWWAHPQAHEIFDALQPVYDDATRVKLVAGKVTLVHRRLWPDLVAVGAARSPWQLDGLGDTGLDALRRIARYQRLVEVHEIIDEQVPKQKDLVRDLERRLLVHSEDVHTEGGSHAKQLETWKSFRTRRNVSGTLPSTDGAQQVFATITASWTTASVLPWQ